MFAHGIPVPANGLCLFYTPAAARDVIWWMKGRRPDGYVDDAAQNQREKEAAIDLRNKVADRMKAAGKGYEADLLRGGAYGGTVEIYYMAQELGGSIEQDNLIDPHEGTTTIGDGKPLFRLGYTTAVDGAGHRSPHYMLRWSLSHAWGGGASVSIDIDDEEDVIPTYDVAPQLASSTVTKVERDGTDATEYPPAKRPKAKSSSSAVPRQLSGAIPPGADTSSAPRRHSTQVTLSAGQATAANGSGYRTPMMDDDGFTDFMRNQQPTSDGRASSSFAGASAINEGSAVGVGVQGQASNHEAGAIPEVDAHCVADFLKTAFDACDEDDAEARVCVDSGDGEILKTIPKLCSEVKDADPALPEFAEHVIAGVLVFVDYRPDPGDTHDQVLLMHLVEGGRYMWAHGGQLFVYKDGGRVPYEGVMPEGAISRVKCYFTLLEGMVKLIHSKKVPGSDRNNLVSKIKTMVYGLTWSNESALRTVLLNASADTLAAGEEGSKWLYVIEQVQRNGSEMAKRLLGSQIVKYYTAWCDTAKDPEEGFATKDALVKFDGTTGKPVYFDKNPKHRIYIYLPIEYIRSYMGDPVLKAAEERVKKFFSQTFFNNGWALRNVFDALCLTLHGLNVDRVFWTIAAGGCGQSLLTLLIHVLMPSMHAYLDSNIYHSDDELRKQAELFVNKLVTTLQERVEGAGHKFRLDLYKKVASADPIAARLPYGILTQMIEIVGWKRMEMNKLLEIDGITEESFDSIWRRSYVCHLIGRFVSEAEYLRLREQIGRDPSTIGVFVKDTSLKPFFQQRNGPAVAGLTRILRGHVRDNSKEACVDSIEGYVEGGDKWLTWRCIRASCGMPASAPTVAPTRVSAPARDPASAAINSSRANADRLIAAMLGNDMETISVYQATRVDPCGKFLPGASPADRKEVFERLVTQGFFKETRRRYARAKLFIPVIQTSNPLSSLFRESVELVKGPYPEIFPTKDLALYMNKHASRGLNAETMAAYFDRAVSDLKQKRLTEEESFLDNEFKQKAAKIRRHEETLSFLMKRCAPPPGQIPPENICMSVNYGPAEKPVSRLYAKDPSAQSMPSRVRSIPAFQLEDFDIENTQFTLSYQIQEKLSVQLDHPAARFDAHRKYIRQREETLLSLPCGRAEAKSTCLATVNGKRIPPHLAHMDILQGLRDEGRLLRWVSASIDPDFHLDLCRRGDKEWPEATTLFYLWSAVESYVMHFMVQKAMELNPKHLSLHFDGLMIDRGSFNGCPHFANRCETAVRDATGYEVKVVRKEVVYTLSGLKKAATAHRLEPLPSACKALGNCIPTAIGIATGRLEEVASLLADDTQSNKAACAEKVRSYRQCARELRVTIAASKGFPMSTGTRLLHSENEGQPHCVCIIIDDDYLRLYDEDGVFTVPVETAARVIGSAVDSGTIVSFSITGGDAPPATLMADAPAEDIFLDLLAGGNDSTQCVVPKRGKKRISNRFRTATAKRPASIVDTSPYVRHGRPTVKCRMDRQQSGRTLRDIYLATPIELVQMLTEDGFLVAKEGTVCRNCNHGTLGALKEHPKRGPVHRCWYQGCRQYSIPHSEHLIFKLGAGPQTTELRDQAAVLLCLSNNAPRALIHELTGVGHKVIEDMATALDRCRECDVARLEPNIQFGESGGRPDDWYDVEGDDVDLRSSVIPEEEVDKSDPEKKLRWEQWTGLVQRGRPDSLVLKRLNPSNTTTRAPGAGCIRAPEWKRIAHSMLRNRKVILHTDGARSYKLRVPGMLHDHVVHKKKPKTDRKGRVIKKNGKTVWLKPFYTCTFKHRLPSGTELQVKGGTQVIDRVWQSLRKYCKHKPGKAGTAQIVRYVRAAQWCYWNQGKSMWSSTGRMLTALTNV